MLVPVLVLGIMGCGSKNLETGNEIPFALHGTWTLTTPAPGTAGISNGPHFIVTANEVTVRIPTTDAGVVTGTVQYAFRAQFGGNRNNPAQQQVTLKLTRIVDGIDWGTYRFAYAGDADNPNAALVATDTLTVQGPVPRWEASLVPYYEFYLLFQEDNVFTRVTDNP